MMLLFYLSNEFSKITSTTTKYRLLYGTCGKLVYMQCILYNVHCTCINGALCTSASRDTVPTSLIQYVPQALPTAAAARLRRVHSRIATVDISLICAKHYRLKYVQIYNYYNFKYLSINSRKIFLTTIFAIPGT